MWHFTIEKRTALVCLTAVAGLVALVSWALAQGPGDALEEGFKNPPDSAKPRTWWHWTGGNITKEGITKDLEWMKRVGIGGMHLADVSSGSGQTVEKKIEFKTPEWLDAVRHAASEADRLGLEMTIFSSAGWSETGGPWVKPEQAMKKAVWSETTVEGPRSFAGKLPLPPSNNGPIRNLRSGGGRGGPPDPTYYGDSVVLAYRTPPEEAGMQDLHPKATTSSGPLDAAALLDDDLNTGVAIAAPEGGGPAFGLMASRFATASREDGSFRFGASTIFGTRDPPRAILMVCVRWCASSPPARPVVPA